MAYYSTKMSNNNLTLEVQKWRKKMVLKSICSKLKLDKIALLVSSLCMSAPPPENFLKRRVTFPSPTSRIQHSFLQVPTVCVTVLWFENLTCLPDQTPDFILCFLFCFPLSQFFPLKIYYDINLFYYYPNNICVLYQFEVYKKLK